jgi:prepilin-type N-terminal cleavage/methylation domain-containing protein
MTMTKYNMTQSGGKAFTLIEVMVSVSIFATVMLVATGAVFSIVEANKKAHSVKSVMTNLNFALESMSRDIRVGSNYRCGDPNTGGDCIDGDTRFTFIANRDINGDAVVNLSDWVTYSKSGTGIDKETGLGTTRITAPEIQIANLKFYVSGTSAGGIQPKVNIVIQGYSGSSTVSSTFNIQTTISQRPSDS